MCDMPAPRASRLRRLAVLGGVLALGVTTVGPVAAAKPVSTPPPAPAAPPDSGKAWDSGFAEDSGGVIVTFAPGTTPASRDQGAAAMGLMRGHQIQGTNFGVYRHDPVAALSRRAYVPHPQVLSVVPDLRLHRDADPTTEPLWPYLWGMDNTGQSVNGSAGTPNVDIDLPQAHAITTGSPSTVVAVIDDGVDFSHPDLAARAWTNPGESGVVNGVDLATDGIDNDHNGYIDDVHGWDFCNQDNTVHDVDHDFHGTHVAGTIAASLDGQGVVGVAPSVSIMALKFLDNDTSKGCGLTSQAIEAIAYAKSFGVVLSNSSWGGRGDLADFKPLYDAIKTSGLLFVTSAGNDGIDNDTDPLPAYPASFDLPNVISVAAADKDGGLASFSNYGHTTVDLAAPGVDIVSSVPADSIHPNPWWTYLDGTSMAAPHVTGVAALLASQDPSLLSDLPALKARLLSSGKSLPLTGGDTVSGRMVDARFALDSVAPTAFAPNTQVITLGAALGTTAASVTIGWPAGTDDASGVGSYDVQQQVNGGAWTSVVTATTARTVARSLVTDATYRFRVRARDRAGNLSPYVQGALITPKRYQETTSLATYAGTWSLASSTSASGGKEKYATRATASVSFRFIGRSVALVAPKSTTRGSLRVYIDGVYGGLISEYHSPSAGHVIVWTHTWTVNGTHIVKFVPVGTAGRPRVDVDAFEVLR